MLLEGIAAFALACNILQIVEYGAKIAIKARGLRPSDESRDLEAEDLESLAKQLFDLNQEFNNSARTRSGSSDPLQAKLIECNNESLRLSRKFIDFVESLRPKHSNSHLKSHLVRSLRQAFRSKLHQEGLETMQREVSEARSNLMLAFLLKTS